MGLVAAATCAAARGPEVAVAAVVWERLVLRTLGGMNQEYPGTPLQTLHVDLVDAADQPVGTLDVVLTFTVVPPPGTPALAPRAVVNAVASLPLGQITIQGTLDTAERRFRLALTGGTGAYRTARGFVRVVPIGTGEESRLVFQIARDP